MLFSYAIFLTFRKTSKTNYEKLECTSATKMIINDIIGRQIGSHFEEGLVDVEEEKHFETC